MYSDEVHLILERVSPRLLHSNSSVVLTALRAVLSLMGHLGDSDSIRLYTKKISAPIVTLLSQEAEIQYVTLR